MVELQSVEIQLDDVQNEENQTDENQNEENVESQTEEGETEQKKSEDGDQKGKKWHTVIKKSVLNATVAILVILLFLLFISAGVMSLVERPNEMNKNLKIMERQGNNSNYTQILEEVLYLLTNELAGTISMREAMTLTASLVAAANDTETETEKWDYGGSLFFMITVFTTIGYGDTAPETTGGQVLVIIFAIIGIPFAFALFCKLGTILKKLIDEKTEQYIDNGKHPWVIKYKQWMKNILQKNIFREKKGEKEDEAIIMKYTKLASFVAFTFIFLIFFPAGAISALEGWNYFQGIYYSIITITTIGFGDLFPGFTNVSDTVNDLYLIFIAVWILIGLSCEFVIIQELQKDIENVAEGKQIDLGDDAKNDEETKEKKSKQIDEDDAMKKAVGFGKILKKGVGKATDAGKKLKVDSKMAEDVGSKFKTGVGGMGSKLKKFTENQLKND